MQLISPSWLCGRNTRRGPSHRLKTNHLCIAALFLLALMPSAGWAQTQYRNVANAKQFSAALALSGTVEITITEGFTLDNGHTATPEKPYNSVYLVAAGKKTIKGGYKTITRGDYINNSIVLDKGAYLYIENLTLDGDEKENYASMISVPKMIKKTINGVQTEIAVNAQLEMVNCTIQNCRLKTINQTQVNNFAAQQLAYYGFTNPNAYTYTFAAVSHNGGAGIHFAPGETPSGIANNKITLTNCVFDSNETLPLPNISINLESGAALTLAGQYARGGTITNCTFKNNKTRYSGGAIWFGEDLQNNSNYPFTFSVKTIVENNSCENNIDTTSSGGGICMEGGYVVFRDEVTISDNTADIGGGISQWGGTLNITTVDNKTIRIVDNTANVAPTGSNLNSGDGGGGGIIVKGGETYFTGTETNRIQILRNKAPNGNGGGIYFFRGKPRFTYCNIGSSGNGNYAAKRGGGIYLGNNQNAFYARFTNCNIEHNYTTSNDVDSKGGGVFNYGTLSNNSTNTFTKCNIRYNGENENGSYITKKGGGVYLQGSTELDSCTIRYNKASDDGGGLYMEDNFAKLKNECHVNNNTANQGGGIYYKNGSFENSNYVYDNTATTYGGGVFVEVLGDRTIDGLVIGSDHEAESRGNKAQQGGGVYTYSQNNTNYRLTIEACKIVHNQKQSDDSDITSGGGLCMANESVTFASYSHTVELTGGTLIDHNKAVNGGGVYLTNNGTLTLELTNATLSNNEATTGNGGGIYNNQTVTSEGASYVSINSNKALNGHGGGVYTSATTNLGGNTTFENNRANGSGGGLYTLSGATTSFLSGEIRFIGNTAAKKGGGIFNFGTVTQEDDCTLTFDNNSANLDGGGVYHFGKPLTLTATFTNNTATTGNGGGIYTEKTCTLTNCTIGEAGKPNKAPNGNGGGIYMNCEELTINGGSVSHNTASNNGGGIYLERNNTFVNNNCRIQNNVATNNGGGIYVQADKAEGLKEGNYSINAFTLLDLTTNDTVGWINRQEGQQSNNLIVDGGHVREVQIWGNNITYYQYPDSWGGHSSQEISVPQISELRNFGIYLDLKNMEEPPIWNHGNHKFIARFKREGSDDYFELGGIVDYYYYNNPDDPDDWDNGNYYKYEVESAPIAAAPPAILTLNGSTVGGAGMGNTAGNFGGGVYISTYATMEVEGAVKVEGNTTGREPGTGTGQYPYLKDSKEDDVCLQTIKKLSSKGEVITHDKGKIKLIGSITNSRIGITEEEIAQYDADLRNREALGNYLRQFTIDYGYSEHGELDMRKLFFSNDNEFVVIKLDDDDGDYATSTGKLEVTLGIPGITYWYVAGIVDDDNNGNGYRWGNDDNSGLAPDEPCRTLTGPNGVFARGYDPTDPNHYIYVVRAISIEQEAQVRALGNNTVVIRYPQGNTYNKEWFQNENNIIPNDNDVDSHEIILYRYPGGHKLSNEVDIDEGGGSPGATLQKGPGPNLGPIVQMNATNNTFLSHITLDGLKDISGVSDVIHSQGNVVTFKPTSAALAVDSVAIGRAKTGTLSLSEGCKVQNNNNTEGSNNVGSSGREKRPGGGVYVAGNLKCINNGFTFIQENNSKLDGGGVYVDKDGIADMLASAVLKNHSDQNGGGIYIANLGKAKFDGTYIGNPDDETEGNTADGNGGGVYKLGSLEAQGIYTNTFVVGNKAGSPLAQNNVHIPANSADTSMIVITGNLGCGSLIGVTKTKDWSSDDPGYGIDGEHEYENDGNFNEVRTPIAKANWWNNSGADDWVRDADRRRVFFDDTEHYGVWRLRYNSKADLCYDESNQTIAEGDKIYSYDDYRLYFIETWRSFANASGLNLSGSDYLVSSPEGLAYLAKQVNSGTDYYLGKTIVQTKDFDLKAHYWEPIGLQYSTCPYNDGDPYIEEYHPFSGNYDGQGHLIQNAFSILPVHGMGLFGVTGARWYQRNDLHLATQPGSYIKNTFVINHNFVITCPNETYSGGIVGLCGTDLIDRCEAHGELNSYEWGDNNSGDGIRYVGGLAGYITDVDNQASEASITNSFSVNSFKTGANLDYDDFKFGGLCGMGFGKIENCYVKSAYPCTSGRKADNKYGALLYGNTNTANPVTLTNCYVIDSDTKYMVLNGTSVGMTYCYAPDTDQYIEYNEGTPLGTSTTPNGNFNYHYSPTIGADQLGYMYADNLVSGGEFGGKPLFEALSIGAETLNGDDEATENTPGYRTYDRWARPALAYYEMFMDISYNDSIGIVRPINGDLPVLMMNNYGDGTNGSVGRGGFTALSTITEPEVFGFEGGPESHPAYLIGDGYVLQYSGPKRDYSEYNNDPYYNDSEIDGMIARSLPGPLSTLDCHFIYGDVSKAPTKTISANRISIYEHAAITEAGTLGSFDMTHVSITFDNSGTNSAVSTDGMNYLGAQELKRDWHLLSTPLLDASTGFNYQGHNSNTYVSGQDYSAEGYFNNPWAGGGSATTPGGTEFGWLGGGNNRYWMTGWSSGSQSVKSGGYVSAEGFGSWTDGYFPSTFDATLHVFGQGTINETDENPGATDNTNARYPYGMDFYSWFEPQYHYINFKRNGPNHWHSDTPHDHLNYTSEKATNNSGDDPFGINVNEERLLTGKGYFASIAEKTLLQSSGALGGEYTPTGGDDDGVKVYRVGVANWGLIVDEAEVPIEPIDPPVRFKNTPLDDNEKGKTRSNEVVYYQNSIFDDLDEKREARYLDLTYLHNLKDSNSNDLSGLYLVSYVHLYGANAQVKITMGPNPDFWTYYNTNNGDFVYDVTSMDPGQQAYFETGINYYDPVADFVMSLFPNNGFQPGGNYLEYVPSYSFTSGNKEIDLYQIFDNHSPITVTHTTDDNQEITGNLYAGKITGWNCHGWEQDSYLDEYISYPLHLFVVDDQTSGSKQSEAESRDYTPFEKTISVTHTEDAKLCNGWNLVGNPFHAYLDFETFQGENNSIENYYIVYNADGFGDTDNNYGDGFSYYVAEGSENGAYASQYLHPHQGFFVNVKAPQDDKATPPALNFSEAHTVLRSAIGTSGSYRGEERHAYPLVNLFLKSDKGCSDVCVVEINRPEWGGATKLRDMYTGNGLFYAFHDNKNYAALFATPDAERIPLKFEPKDTAGDTYTLSWNTANGEFSKLILVDNLTGVQYDMLRNSSYSFSGKKGDYYSRFYITFDVTGIEEEEEEDDDTTGTASTSFAFFDGSEWVVTNSSHGPAQLDFIDLQGRVLHSTTLAEGQARIGLPDVAKGMYLMRLNSNNGTKVQKIIVK